eukprot:1156619-Pelagomonas_calceolata.AAC.7
MECLAAVPCALQTEEVAAQWKQLKSKRNSRSGRSSGQKWVEGGRLFFGASKGLLKRQQGLLVEARACNIFEIMVFCIR